MTETDQNRHEQDTTPDQAASSRRSDDRRGEVKPTENPVPSSPAADEEAVQKGEEILERIKPY